MTGLDYEFADNWQLRLTYGTYMEYSRKQPVRLRDREALRALLTTFAQYAGGKFMIMLDEVDYEYTTVDDLIDLAPPKVRVLHLQASDGALVVRLTAWQGGQTWVSAPGAGGYPNQDALTRLSGLVEATSRPLGVRRFFTKSRFKFVRRWGPSVVVRTKRDVLSARRAALVATLISAVSGFLAGVLGAIATLAAGR